MFRTAPGRAIGVAIAGFLPAVGLVGAFQFTGYFAQTVHGWSPGQYAAMVFFGGGLGIAGNVVAGHLAVVRDECDKCVVSQAAIVEHLQDSSDLVIDECDETPVVADPALDERYVIFPSAFGLPFGERCGSFGCCLGSVMSSKGYISV